MSVGWIDLFDDNMENIVDTYRISIKSINETYRMRLVKRYTALVYSVLVFPWNIDGYKDTHVLQVGEEQCNTPKHHTCITYVSHI